MDALRLPESGGAEGAPAPGEAKEEGQDNALPAQAGAPPQLAPVQEAEGVEMLTENPVEAIPTLSAQQAELQASADPMKEDASNPDQIVGLPARNQATSQTHQAAADAPAPVPEGEDQAALDVGVAIAEPSLLGVDGSTSAPQVDATPSGWSEALGAASIVPPAFPMDPFPNPVELYAAAYEGLCGQRSPMSGPGIQSMEQPAVQSQPPRVQGSVDAVQADVGSAEAGASQPLGPQAAYETAMTAAQSQAIALPEGLQANGDAPSFIDPSTFPLQMLPVLMFSPTLMQTAAENVSSLQMYEASMLLAEQQAAQAMALSSFGMPGPMPGLPGSSDGVMSLFHGSDRVLPSAPQTAAASHTSKQGGPNLSICCPISLSSWTNSCMILQLYQFFKQFYFETIHDY